SLTSLTLDGYDLRGDINSNAEYDKLVVQILAKAVTSGTIDSGLRILSASGCGLSAISDVLDLTPIASGDSTTDQFKLTSLDLSNNSISDVSVLITSSIFPNNFLTTLDISDNNICDIEGIVSQLQTEFPTLSSITYSDQTCNCSASVSSANHQVCREVYPNRWAVECWNGYYLDKASGECVAACDSGYEYDTTTETCVSSSSSIDDAIRIQVCERHSNMMAVLEVGATSITCGCRATWYGDDCDQLYQVYIPDSQYRMRICQLTSHGFTMCDVSEFEMAQISILDAKNFSLRSIEGSEKLINIAEIDVSYNFITLTLPTIDLSQILILYYYTHIHDAGVYTMDILDISESSYKMTRLTHAYILANPHIYDISVFYRNIAIEVIQIADTTSGLPYPNYISMCRSEDDSLYWSYLSSIFPLHHNNTPEYYFYPNECPLNDVNLQYYCDDSQEDSDCPSVIRNEVYNNIDNEKQCSFIAKEGTSGACFTVHDDYIRAYLSDANNNCLTSTDIEDNDVISVATLRSALTCSSLSLTDVVAYNNDISSVNDITTLQGLEYAQGIGDSSTSPIGLTSLNVDGYDLSQNSVSSEYDQLVIKILAKAVSASPIESGLTTLSASNCGLYEFSEILDLTPIVADTDLASDKTVPFKLATLNVSNNNISDVSVLFTSSLFPSDALVSLDISGNNICDVEGMVSVLQTKFTFSSITYSDQTCHCSASVSSSSYQVCREVYPNRWAVECWNGYYLDKASGECVAACDSGYEYDTENETCITTSGVDDAIRIQVCERHSNMKPVLEVGASYITCGCRSGFHGDSCEYVYIPDSNLRSAVCLSVSNPTAHDSSCDDLTPADMATVTSVHASIVDSLEGLQHAVNLTSLSISGTSSSSVSIGNTDLGYLPLSLVELSLEAVYLAADSDFSIFTNLTTLSLKNNSSYDLTNSALFPSSSSSSSSTFTSLDVSYTALSSFSSIPTSITTLTANNCSSLTSFSTISNLTKLVSLDVSYASNVLDFSSLLSSPPTSISILYADGCNVSPDTDFTSFTNLTTLSLKNNSSYDLTNSALFPSSSSSSSSTFTSLDVSYTALSSFSSIPTSITTLTANNCSSLTSFSTISNLTKLVSLDVSYASNVLDFSSLLSSPPTSISILYADGCNVSPDTDFTSFTNLTTLSLNDNPLYDITESGLFPSPSSLTSFSANNTSISLLFHL
ncbi:hypothetical protein ADUPG1_000069, partial [Aduncisulcus paluster]